MRLFLIDRPTSIAGINRTNLLSFVVLGENKVENQISKASTNKNN